MGRGGDLRKVRKIGEGAHWLVLGVDLKKVRKIGEGECAGWYWEWT